MKFLSLIAGALAFGSALAAPFPGAESGSDLEARARKAVYKLPAKPATGKTGVWTDPSTKTTHIYYGDAVKVHGSHIEYHNSVYPQHANKPFKLASGTSKKGEIADNRKAALRKISTQGKGFIRDEKPLASLSHGAKRTTVMKVPEKESLIEAHLARIAKSEAKKNGGTVQLHDHRTVTGTGPLGKILKKRELEEALLARGLGDKLKDGVDDLKNKTESAGQHVESGTESAKNSTSSGLSSEIEAEIEKWEKKMAGLIGTAAADLKEAGDDFITAVEQLVFGSGHQMGSFYQGMHNFDAVEEAMQANGTKLSDDDLAQDQAAIDVYLGGYVNATKGLGADVMNDFYKFTDLVTGADSSDESSATPATDLFSVGDWTPDNCTETTSASNSTATANAKRSFVKLW